MHWRYMLINLWSFVQDQICNIYFSFSCLFCCNLQLFKRMCHIQGDHETPCLYVQDRCWYVDRTLAFPSSCILCYHQKVIHARSWLRRFSHCDCCLDNILELPDGFEEDLVYHRRGTWGEVRCSRKTSFICLIACRLCSLHGRSSIQVEEGLQESCCF